MFIGLRGPVLRGWACVLEVHPVDAGDHLDLEPVDERLPYRKHFLNLGGLGIRDLLVLGDDLLILAGPTMALDGACAIWRWKKGAVGGAASRVSRRCVDAADARHGRSRRGLHRPAGREVVMVVYDTPHADRLGDDGTLLTDIVRL